MALYSSIDTSARSALQEFGLKKAHIGSMSRDMKSEIEGAAYATFGIGGIVIFLIYELCQIFGNEPKKQREQFEIGCRVATEPIDQDPYTGESSILMVQLNSGDEITYIQRANGVFVRHGAEIRERQLFKDKNKTPFITLEEFQAYRRDELRKNQDYFTGKTCADLRPLCSEELLPLFKDAISKQRGDRECESIEIDDAKLTETLLAKTAGQIFKALGESVEDLRKRYKLTQEDIDAALEQCANNLEIIATNIEEIPLYIVFLQLAELHNTLSKVGTEAFDKSALLNFNYVYNIESDVITVVGLQNPAEFPPLSNEEKKLLLTIEIAKLDIKNAKILGDKPTSSPYSLLVSRKVIPLLHDIYRPDDAYSRRTGHDPLDKPFFIAPPSLPQTRVGLLTKQQQENKALLADINGGTYDPGTVFGIVGYSIDTQSGQPKFCLKHRLVTFALTHQPKNSDPSLQMYVKTINNPEIWTILIDREKKYTDKKSAYDALFTEIYRLNLTLNVQIIGSARNNMG